MKMYLSPKLTTAQINKIYKKTTVYYDEDRDLDYILVEENEYDSVSEFLIHEQGDQMFRVTFKARPVKIGKKLRTFPAFEETHKSEADVRLRAMALNWDIVKIERI